MSEITKTSWDSMSPLEQHKCLAETQLALAQARSQLTQSTELQAGQVEEIEKLVLAKADLLLRLGEIEVLNDRLTRQAEEITKSIYNLRLWQSQILSSSSNIFGNIADQMEFLSSQNTALREALIKFGRHFERCQIYSSGAICDCGYESTLKNQNITGGEGRCPTNQQKK